MRKPATGLAYSLGAFDPPRDMRSAAIMPCNECDQVGKIVVVGSKNNPEKIASWFRRIGWETDGFHLSQNVCPKCIEKAKLKRKLELEQRQREQLTPGKIIPALAPARPTAAPRHFEEVILVAGTRAGITKISDLTREQKAEIRKELEAHFDEDKGNYLDEYSDEVISEGLGIPRKVIEEFREGLYGPLLTDPEVAAIEAMYNDAKKVMSNLQASLARLDTKIEELKKKRGYK